MRDLKQEGKENKPEIKAGGQDRGNVKPGGAYNPSQQKPEKTQTPLPGKGGQNIGGGGIGTDKGQGAGQGKTDFNKDKGTSWK